MRHLVRNGMVPKDLDLAGLPDPVLAPPCWASPRTPSPADWDRLWQRAEAAAGAPWAMNLQERLLLALSPRRMTSELRPYPGAFPVPGRTAQ